jgi:hypothetical protein
MENICLCLETLMWLSNKYEINTILRQLCFDGPTHPHLHKTQRGWRTWRWLKKMDSISYVYISRTIHGMWIIYITFEKEVLNFQIPPLERSPSAQSCSSVSWEQNGYYAAQALLVLRCIPISSYCYLSAIMMIWNEKIQIY